MVKCVCVGANDHAWHMAAAIGVHLVRKRNCGNRVGFRVAYCSREPGHSGPCVACEAHGYCTDGRHNITCEVGNTVDGGGAMKLLHS